MKEQHADWLQRIADVLEGQYQTLLAAARKFESVGDPLSGQLALTSAEALRLLQLIDVFDYTHGKGFALLQVRPQSDGGRALAPLAPLLAHLARFHSGVFPEHGLHKALQLWVRAVHAAVGTSNFGVVNRLLHSREFISWLAHHCQALHDCADIGYNRYWITTLLDEPLLAAVQTGMPLAGEELADNMEALTTLASVFCLAASMNAKEEDITFRVPSRLYMFVVSHIDDRALYKTLRANDTNVFSSFEVPMGLPPLDEAVHNLQWRSVRLMLLGELYPAYADIRERGISRDTFAEWLRKAFDAMQHRWLGAEEETTLLPFDREDPYPPLLVRCETASGSSGSDSAAVGTLTAAGAVSTCSSTTFSDFDSPAALILSDLIAAGVSPDCRVWWHGREGYVPGLAREAYYTHEGRWGATPLHLRPAFAASAARFMKLLIRRGAHLYFCYDINDEEDSQSGPPTGPPSRDALPVIELVAEPYRLEVAQEAAWARRKHALAAREAIRELEWEG